MKKSDIYLPGGANAVLLIHGLTGSPYEMKYLAEQLNRSGYTVSVPCLAGHDTSLADLKQKKWQDWYATVKQAFLELKEHHSHLYIAGLCMGAVLTLQLSHEMGPSVAAIGLFSTTLIYDGWGLPWYKFLAPLTYYTPIRYFYDYPECEPYGIKNKRLRAIVAKGLKDNSVAYDKVPGVSMCESFRLVKNVKKNIRSITTPTLIIHSLEDDTASVNNANYIERQIGSSSVRKVIINDCYHMITIDNQREQVAHETISFFNKHSV